MAFNIDPSISLNVKGPQYYTLPELVNIARGAQAFKQAQQINPLEVQKTQADVQTAQTQAAQTQLALNKEKLGIALNTFSPLMNEPDVIAASKLPLDATPEQRQEASNKIIKLMGQHEIDAENAGLTPAEVKKLTLPYYQLAMQQPEAFSRYLDQGIQRLGGATTQAQQNLPTIQTNSAGQFVGITPSTGGITIAGKSANAPIENANPSTAETTLKTGLSQAGVQNFDAYQKDLTARFQGSVNNLLRTTEARDLLNKFKPGAGSSTYAEIAQKLQAIGAPQNLVDQIAGGDLGATQSFNKFLAQSIIAGVRQASGGDQARVAEVENFIKNNPTVNTDPRALNRLFDFTDKLAQKDFAEQDFLTQKLKNGTVNPASHFGEVQQFLRQQGYIPKIGEQKSKEPAQGNHGKPVAQATKNGVTYIKYEDGTVLPK